MFTPNDPDQKNKPESEETSKTTQETTLTPLEARILGSSNK